MAGTAEGGKFKFVDQIYSVIGSSAHKMLYVIEKIKKNRKRT